MKEKTQRSIRICSIIALVFCILWALFYLFYFIGLLTGFGPVTEAVDWSQNKTVRVAFFVMDVFATIFVISLCVKLVLNTFKGIHENTVFPKSNVKLLFWLALAFFLYLLCWVNTPILFQENFVFRIVHINFVTPFFLLFFAFMYKVAADAVEENNLTI